MSSKGIAYSDYRKALEISVESVHLTTKKKNTFNNVNSQAFRKPQRYWQNHFPVHYYKQLDKILLFSPTQGLLCFSCKFK